MSDGELHSRVLRIGVVALCERMVLLLCTIGAWLTHPLALLGGPEIEREFVVRWNALADDLIERYEDARERLFVLCDEMDRRARLSDALAAGAGQGSVDPR